MNYPTIYTIFFAVIAAVPMWTTPAFTAEEITERAVPIDPRIQRSLPAVQAGTNLSVRAGQNVSVQGAALP